MTVASRDTALLVATSGDTGSAALHGFGQCDHTCVIVLYPLDGVSSIQKEQMIRTKGINYRIVIITTSNCNIVSIYINLY